MNKNKRLQILLTIWMGVMYIFIIVFWTWFVLTSMYVAISLFVLAFLLLIMTIIIYCLWNVSGNIASGNIVLNLNDKRNKND